MIARCCVLSWGVSTILAHCAMTMSPEPDPDAPQRATDGAAGLENDRPPPHRGELRLVSPRRDRYPSVAAAAALPPAGGESASDASARARRLRLAAPVQLELVSAGEGPAPEVVWASLPQRSREMVLALLARLIDSGAVEEGGAA